MLAVNAGLVGLRPRLSQVKDSSSLQAELAIRRNALNAVMRRKRRRRRRRRKRRRKRKRKRKRKGRRKRKKKGRRRRRKRRKKRKKKRKRMRRRRRQRRRRKRRRRPKITSSETVICVRGSQSLHIKTENVRRGGMRKSRKRPKRRKKKGRKGRKGRVGKSKKGSGKTKEKGGKKKQRKRKRYKRHIENDTLYLSKPTVLKIYRGIDENRELSATYFVTDHTVNESPIAEGPNPSLKEIRSVVEAIDGGVQDDVERTSMNSGHRITKRSAKRKGVRCYRVLNYGRYEKGKWQRMVGSRHLVHRGKLSASVIENADVHIGALLRASKRISQGRSPTIVLGRDGRTLRCTPEMMRRADPVGARCRAVMRCEHGGRWKRVGRGYRCRCTFGYGGPRCAHRATRCPPGRSPCRNGGTCMEMPPSRRRRGRQRLPPFRCFCPHHFTGRLCQRRRPSARVRCSSKPCLGGGRCRDLPKRAGYLCICPKGLSGHRCQHQRSDVCQPDGRGPCRHDGRCLSAGGGSYFCLCHANFGGRHCQLPVGGVSLCPRSFCHHRGAVPTSKHTVLLS